MTDGVFYRDSAQASVCQPAGLWPADWRLLSESPNGRSSFLLKLQPGEGVRTAGSYASDIELFVHRGAISLGDAMLGYRDYALVPAEAVVSQLIAEEATELLFYSAGDSTWTARTATSDGGEIDIIRYEEAPWKGGEVSKAAGEDIPLRIKHYRNDPETGARTFIVASGPEAAVPWERHTVAEEGFLIEGDYTLAEQLPDGTHVGEYRAGGYFYRPPGVIHSGPDSFTRNGAMWLIRTPAALDVEFLEDSAVD